MPYNAPNPDEDELAALRKVNEQLSREVLAIAKDRDDWRAKFQQERGQRIRAEDDVTSLLNKLADARRDLHEARSARGYRQEGGKW